MSKKRIVETAYGPVDHKALERLQHRFDTRRLLDIVDALDQMRSRLDGAEGLRQELLVLHGMAHALLNGADLPVGSASVAPIWELAEHLSSELLEGIEALKVAYETIDALTTLAPGEEWEDEEE
jgi:hypothetical protein